MAGDRQLKGQNVAITGGAGGIGLALAKACLGAGANVALLDIDVAALAQAQTTLARDNEVLTRRCDITDPEDCVAAVEAICKRWGGLDVLVNNAGITHRSLFADTEPDVLRRVMEINLFGSVNCTRAALSQLVERRGAVVALSSVAGFAPLLGRSGYCASKHAMHGFFDTLRVELAPAGVDVLVVCPSFTDTSIDRAALTGTGDQVGKARKAVGKQLTPGEVAEAIVDGLRRRRRSLVLSPVGKASLWLSRLIPRAYEHLMVRSQGAEFDY